MRFVGVEGLQRAEIRRLLHEHGVARMHEQLGDEVESLLRAGRDDDVVDVARHAAARHVVDDPAAQRRRSLR